MGDESADGIGTRALRDILPSERTTPAGRFVAGLGKNLGTQEVLWVDYENAISLHRVITTSQTEHRLQRLATGTPLDNRISYGCINVPVDFFERVVAPIFSGTAGIVYILPETKALHAVFSAYEVQ